jgi:uncharacterized protein (TIGR01777 family)
MKNIAITGASGLIGKALCAELQEKGYSVFPLARIDDDTNCGWNPRTGAVRLQRYAHADAVFHLAGERVVGRWTPAKKRAIMSSRSTTTKHLAAFLAASPRPPEAMICASAIGIYGNRCEELLDENSMAGTGFLAQVSAAWEDAAAPARLAGIRVAHARLGVVLSREGGALAASLPPFRFGLGAKLGNGTQWQSWISLEDTVRALIHILETELNGPVNVVAPHSVTNAQFTRALGAQLKRPALLSIPAFVLRAALGEAADEMLLSSAHVVPRVLEHSGFRWNQPTIEAAFAHELG